MYFCKVFGIGSINVCANFEINRYQIHEFRKHAKIVFYLTSRDAKNGASYVIAAAILR